MPAIVSDSDFTPTIVDDFNSGGLDHDIWGWPFGGGAYWNDAFDWSHDDVNVVDGRMVVSATWHEDAGHEDTGRWTAGGINMLGAGHGITYGRVEFDARVDQGQGTGAAILLWPTSNDVWPPEIDILEVPDGQRQSLHFTNHWQGPGGNGDNWYESQEIAVDASAWHRYRLDWTPDAIRLSIDGVLRGEFTSNIPDIPMSFGVMGYVAAPWEGWYGGGPDATTPTRVNTEVDNVVVSQWNGTWSGGAPRTLAAGQGPDALLLEVSQDAFQGDALYTVAVNGAPVGGVFAASAAHGSGASDLLTLRGDWGDGPVTVTVTMVNDLWLPGAGDRNLYVTGATYNGVRSDALGEAWYGGSFTVESPWDGPGSDGAMLVGGSAAETLVGGAGDDLLVGGEGHDRLRGRAGADSFGFEEGDGRDRVRRFESGEDRLVFHGIAPDSLWTEVTTIGSKTGLAVHYGGRGDVVFLPGVFALRPGDVAFV